MGTLPKAVTFRVDLEPTGRRVTIGGEQTVLDAAQAAGVELAAVCGGAGVCGKCRVRLMSGQLSPPTAAERHLLAAEPLAAGCRLACQCRPRSDVKVNVPPESLLTAQRLQVDGIAERIAPDPPVVPVDVRLEAPSLADLRADSSRLAPALAGAGVAMPQIELPVLRDLSTRLRAQDWQVRLALRGDRLVSVLPLGSPLLGLAVDIGTTKLAAYLLDLSSGEVLAKTGATNPQVAYGEDVMSRIAYANDHAGRRADDGRDVLHGVLAARLNELIAELCDQAGASREQLVEGVLVGNTAMHHLFAGLPVRQLGFVPYVPAVSEPLTFPAHQVGLDLAAGAHVYLPPNIAGFVGADHVAMLLASRILEKRGNVLAIDIGTNTEVSLWAGGQLLTCSCASGPAFEGAHIRDGMRAVPGAIERVKIQNGTIFTQTVGDKPAVGICGSGILDAIAEMRGAGVLEGSGRFAEKHRGPGGNRSDREFTLVPATSAGHGRSVGVTAGDVREIQLAKGAIRAGIEILLQEGGLGSAADAKLRIDEFIIAGAFGTYLDIESALRIGMFPPVPLDRFQQVGNAAGIGAQWLLISRAKRAEAAQIAQRARYVELTTHPGFTRTFAHALIF